MAALNKTKLQPIIKRKNYKTAENVNSIMTEAGQYIEQRKKKLEEIKKLNINPYPYSFNLKNTSLEIHEEFKKLKPHEKTNKKVSIAGRIITMRVMGKASFSTVQDHLGKIQLYITLDNLGEPAYNLFKKFDLGDIIGVEGIVFRTKMGEITVQVSKLELLCKSIRPLPEKWHGLKDIEIRYRKRYLDLIANPEIKNTFIKRTEIINAMREFLKDKGFLEVETPILQPVYGGANARPFKSFLHELKMDVYLRISNELYLKRLIVGGFDKVFEIGKDFRNESIDKTHNPEFTMMECYWAYADYEDVMNLTEDMFICIAKKVLGKTKIDYQGKLIDLKKPWQRLTMLDSLKKYAKIDIEKHTDRELKELLNKNHIELKKEFSRGNAIQALFEELVEENLINPVFITDHPKETTALCKGKRGNPLLIERFEPFINGMEMGNAYSELNDPIIQRQLLEEQAKQLKAGDEEANPADEDFLEAIEVGMPPTGGLGIGIDRLIMILTNQPSIRDALLFPFMKPEKQP